VWCSSRFPLVSCVVNNLDIFWGILVFFNWIKACDLLCCLLVSVLQESDILGMKNRLVDLGVAL
jgi:hypothetical protein